MVNLQNLRNAINESPFSDDAKRALLEIVDSAISKGNISPEQKEKLLSIMDLEIDENETTQKVYEDVAEMLEGFVAGVDAANQTAADNLDALQEEQTNSSVGGTSPTDGASQATEAQFQAPQPEPMASQASESPATPVVPETPPETPAQ